MLNFVLCSLQVNFISAQLKADSFHYYYEVISNLKSNADLASNLDSLTSARILSNLGNVKSILDLPDALENLERAKQIKEDLNYTSGILTSYHHLIEYYKKRNQKKMALDYANKGLELARLSNNSIYLESALSNLMELNDSPEVIEFVSLKDSLESANQKARDNFAYYRYQFSENERLFKESELKRERLLVIVILIVFSSVLIVLVLSSKYKNEKLAGIYKTEARISKKIHDEIANDIYYVMSKIQSNNYNVLDSLESIYNKTRDISRENGVIDFKGDFKEQLNDMLLSFMNEKVTILTTNINNINWSQLSEVKKTTIYRVLQELMVNMKKHSDATFVILKFHHEAGSIFIVYSDNGKGCNLDKKGGLVNVEYRVKTINGTVSFDSKPNNGFHVKMYV